MIHGALGLACGIVIGAVGAAIVADWYVSRELARMTDRFLAVDQQPTVDELTNELLRRQRGERTG